MKINSFHRLISSEQVFLVLGLHLRNQLQQNRIQTNFLLKFSKVILFIFEITKAGKQIKYSIVLFFKGTRMS
jgi:hypothetical protein